MPLPFDETIDLEGGGQVRLVRANATVPLEMYVRDHLDHEVAVRLTDPERAVLEQHIEQAE